MSVPRSSWGPSEDETFFFQNIPDVPASKVAVVRQSNNLLLYVEYVKGDETELNLKLSFSPFRDDPVVFFDEAVVRDASGLVFPFVHRFTVTGRYRLGVLLGVAEDGVNVTVYRIGGTPGAAGSVDLAFVTGNLRSR